VDEGILILRLMIGLLVAGHGAQKAFGWFVDRAETVAGFRRMGMHPPEVFVATAGWAQLVGGSLFAAGAFTPLGSALIAGTSVMAIRVAKWGNGLWNQRDGYEYLLVLVAVAVAIALTGAGDYSVDGGAWPFGSGLGLTLVATSIVAGMVFPTRLASSANGSDRLDS
jgi:putative oxidoreductase